MRVGLFAGVALAILIVVGAAGYLVGKSSATTASDAQDAQQAGFAQAFKASSTTAAVQAKQVAFVSGRREGRQAGSDDGAKKANAQVAAAQTQTTSSTGGCPPGYDAFGTP